MSYGDQWNWSQRHQKLDAELLGHPYSEQIKAEAWDAHLRAIEQVIELRRGDVEFMERLDALCNENRELLDRLARGPEPIEDPIDYERGVRALQRAEPVDDEVEITIAKNRDVIEKVDAEAQRLRDPWGHKVTFVAYVPGSERQAELLTFILGKAADRPFVTFAGASVAVVQVEPKDQVAS